MKINKQYILNKMKIINNWSNKKKISLVIGIYIILYIFFYFINLIQFFSIHCPIGQIMDSWKYSRDGKIVVKSCTYPYPCPQGKILKASCGNLIDYTSCSLMCLGKNEVIYYKPVIYLYPDEKKEIKVKLDYEGELIADYPVYDYNIKGWDVIADKDGKIINKADNKEYSYLFWEGIPEKKINWDLAEGFVVKGNESREFLQEILPKIGLTPKEYNEFIVYWYPIMQKNKYNLVHFSGKQYTDLAKLETEPKYDSILRVFMVIKPLENPIKIQPQIFKKFERKGFSVVEWGGTILN